MKTSFNLLKPQRAPETFWEKFYVWALTVCRYIIIGVLLVVIVAFIYRFITDMKKSDLKDSLREKTRKLALYKDEEAKINELSGKLIAYNSLINLQGKVNPVMTDLYSFMPDNIEKLELGVDEDKLFIKGVLPEEDLTKFEKDFKTSKSFRNVILSVRSKEENTTGSDKVSFEFQAEPIRSFANSVQ
ncbi:FeoB-associated Cys-rich membrane protein [Candidatus Dojkabacteria bacterium]|uniref:FeoB-associated Cys-rich membrane protein n=1 Tax=Candidatus Dojkabacteria bacterium TaxID=2099670 RepID=A0A955RHX4_9BACT|nr:FeoB-associated Cys-rich membrane protein [Candidatus Dojkabacteria bacterium]